VPQPTPDHPVDYAPIIAGSHEEGQIVGGEKEPKRTDVLRLLCNALNREGDHRDRRVNFAACAHFQDRYYELAQALPLSQLLAKALVAA
jgi:hypothetical protein